MLVLSRRVGQTVVIPELGIVFCVCSIGRHRVQVGVVAPEHVGVWRGELKLEGRHVTGDQATARAGGETDGTAAGGSMADGKTGTRDGPVGASGGPER